MNSISNLNSPLLTFYGDDFTGSTDVMESLTRAGIPTALFVQPPTPQQLARFPNVKVIGVAGISRALAPDVMRQELTPIFEQFKALGAPLVHYKMCSTFDSSPQIGSIGCALDLGQEIFCSQFVPMVIGAPVLGRYVTFGNLFARSGLDSEPYRLDRHPTMSQHPLTPMDESDIRLHLAKQTDKEVALFDVLQLDQPLETAGENFAVLLQDQPDGVLFDTLYPSHLPTIGALIWRYADSESSLFCVGSSGLEYALTAYWRECGELPEPPTFQRREVEQIVVVSGSCSPVTERQIRWALENGFEQLPLDTVQLLNASTQDREIARAVDKARQILRLGQSPILHSALGPNDPRLAPTKDSLQQSCGSSSELLGRVLGRVLREVWQDSGLVRAAVTGGDTSGYVARELGIEALEMVAPIAPGSPLCRVASPDHPLHGREIVFKGGQVGKTDFFGAVLQGGVV